MFTLKRTNRVIKVERMEDKCYQAPMGDRYGEKEREKNRAVTEMCLQQYTYKTMSCDRVQGLCPENVQQ